MQFHSLHLNTTRRLKSSNEMIDNHELKVHAANSNVTNMPKVCALQERLAETAYIAERLSTDQTWSEVSYLDRKALD